MIYVLRVPPVSIFPISMPSPRGSVCVGSFPSPACEAPEHPTFQDITGTTKALVPQELIPHKPAYTPHASHSLQGRRSHNPTNTPQAHRMPDPRPVPRPNPAAIIHNNMPSPNHTQSSRPPLPQRSDWWSPPLSQPVQMVSSMYLGPKYCRFLSLYAFCTRNHYMHRQMSGPRSA